MPSVRGERPNASWRPSRLGGSNQLGQRGRDLGRHVELGGGAGSPDGFGRRASGALEVVGGVFALPPARPGEPQVVAALRLEQGLVRLGALAEPDLIELADRLVDAP